jgi:hypothetical protein
MENQSAEFYKNECEQLWKFIYESGLDVSKLVFERSPIEKYITALKASREGLLAAAAGLHPHAPAMKEVVKGIEACDLVLGKKEGR